MVESDTNEQGVYGIGRVQDRVTKERGEERDWLKARKVMR